MPPMRFTVLGLSITSSWGNGHATTFRALLRALDRRGHRVTFLERDVSWYANNRDLPHPDFCETILYDSVDELARTHAGVVADADAVIVGSYVPEGVRVGRWAIETARGVTAFYDIDTPITLRKIEADDDEYLTRSLIPQFGLYLSFTGGPTLRRIEDEFGSPAARELYCSVDPEKYAPMAVEPKWDLGYLGTYSDDRQPGLERLLLKVARALPAFRFVVAGPQYPEDIDWPENVERIDHVPPAAHARFYNECRFTLNLTRADMRRAGWSPSVRLFEAAACATPIISDTWPGIDELLTPEREILLCENTEDVVEILRNTTEGQRRSMGDAARERILAQHSSDRRAEQLERYVLEAQASLRPTPHGDAALMTTPAK